MFNKNQRMTREKNTVEAMIEIYCHDHHETHDGLCPDCRKLFDYAKRRLDKCPFQAGKTICANCKTHCYKSAMREKIKAVMKYSGPRMTYRHPILAIFHLIDGFRKEPVRSKK